MKEKMYAYESEDLVVEYDLIRCMDEIMGGFAEAQANARSKLEALTNEGAMSEWSLTRGEEQIWTLPKLALARTLMFNHLYHHRGQLSVYLRLLDVPVPATYGRSADESTFN